MTILRRTMRHGYCFALLLVVLLCSVRVGRAQTLSSSPLPIQMLSRTATLALKVDAYDNARNQVLEASAMHHAEFMDAKTLVNEKGKKHGWLRLRVDAAQLPALLAALSPLGKTYAENVATADQQSQFEELGRRVERLQQHEQRLGGVLQSPKHMRGSDILYLQERLFRASVDESLLSQQRINLERSAEDSTLLVELFEPGALPIGTPQKVNLGSWFTNAHAIAQSARDRTLARAATVSAYTLVYAAFWVPVALLCVILVIILWRYRRPLWMLLQEGVTYAVVVLMRLFAWLKIRWEHRHDPLGIAHFPPGAD